MIGPTFLSLGSTLARYSLTLGQRVNSISSTGQTLVTLTISNQYQCCGYSSGLCVFRPSSCTLKPRFLSVSSKTYAKFVVETLFNIEKNSFHRNFWNYIGNFITIESKKKRNPPPSSPNSPPKLPPSLAHCQLDSPFYVETLFIENMIPFEFIHQTELK